VISFLRRGKEVEETLVFVCNFTPVPRHGYRLGVPYAGIYEEILNSDASCYGGSGLVNTQEMPSGPMSWQSCPHSILLTLPPLSTVILKRRHPASEEGKAEEVARVEESTN
jgi:1,4-alpha-glucan branching enzyme